MRERSKKRKEKNSKKAEKHTQKPIAGKTLTYQQNRNGAIIMSDVDIV
jgi:hypothetical protein